MKGFLVIGFGGAAVEPAFRTGNNQAIAGKLAGNGRGVEVFKIHSQRFSVAVINIGGKGASGR